MNAADTIHAAIERLEQQKAAAEEAAYGPWEITPPAREGDDPWFPALCIAVARSTWDACIDPTAAELIVTLHRTIDVQLEAMRLAFEIGADSWVEGTALALARAILGEDAE